MRKTMDRFINHRYTDLAVVLLILSSVALLVLESTLPAQEPLFVWAESIGHALTAVFVIELLLRLYAMPNRHRFIRLYWLDVIAVVPFARSLRILRVLRLLRLLRLGVLLNRRLSGLGAAIRQGKAELVTIAVVVLIVVLAGAIGLNMVEGQQGNAFESIHGSIWWSLYTLIAAEPILGTPETFWGRTVALVVMLAGLGFFATFTGVVSAGMVNRLSRRMEVREMALEDVREHLVLCGWNRAAPRVLEEISADEKLRDKPVVLISEMTSEPQLGSDSVRPDRFFFIRGDFTRVEVLRQANIEQANTAILLADSSVERSDQDRDARTVLAALTIEKLNPGIFTCVQLLNRDNRTHLAMVGVEEIVVPDDYAGKIIAASSRTRGLVSVFDELLTSRYGNQIYKARAPAEWTGQTIGWAHREMKERFNAVLLSVEQRSGGKCRVRVNPPPDEQIAEGDQIIFIAQEFPAHLSQESRDEKQCAEPV